MAGSEKRETPALRLGPVVDQLSEELAALVHRGPTGLEGADQDD